MKTLQELARQSAHDLAGAGVEDPGRESRMLLRCAAGLTAESLVIAIHERTSPSVEKRMFGFVQRRLKREPIQYIVEEAHFYGRTFFVNKDVFIPRPETELLVDEVLNFVARRDFFRLRIVDACTGSGVIGVTLAKELPEASVFATDIADLEVARRNAEKHGVQIAMRQCQCLEGLLDRYEVITANPPYIPSRDINDLQPEVLCEPIRAFDGGEDGLSVVRMLIKSLPSKLADGGLAVLEISPVHAEKARRLACGGMPGASVSLLRDFSGYHRVLRIEAASTD